MAAGGTGRAAVRVRRRHRPGGVDVGAQPGERCHVRSAFDGIPPPTSPTSPSRAEAIQEWESSAREHFRESATALQEVSEASTAEDEAGLRTGCQRLHDTNSIGLQQDLPSPDPQLTDEVQRMIDDMNVAAHACLRFALGRNPTDADNYQQYLARAADGFG